MCECAQLQSTNLTKSGDKTGENRCEWPIFCSSRPQNQPISEKYLKCIYQQISKIQ